MSKITRRACDECRREADDWVEHKGWITFVSVPNNAGIEIGRSDGRTISRGYACDLDFCGIDCLMAYFNKEGWNKQ